jgi:hypothetical protein|tara:strand:+ start:515 stop:823 length:309 start_codon:yes stop_codon:yes gene_type:complete
MTSNESLYRALANIYIVVEKASPRTDVLDSRPRPVSKEFQEIYIEMVNLLENILEIPEGRILIGARKRIQARLPQSGSFLGYADEGLDLAQMISRKVGWGKR